MRSDDVVEFNRWRPPRWVRAAAGVAAVAVLAWVAVALIRTLRSRPPGSPGPHPTWVINAPGGVDALAVGGPLLYVAAGNHPAATLSAFSRATGHLIRRIGVPSAPVALRVGPGGSVWLSFQPDQNGGGTGLWLLSPDLGQRSSLNLRTAARIDLSAVLPVGSSTALVAANGPMELRMPAPGHPGQAVVHQVPGLPVDHGYIAGQFTQPGERIAVLQPTNAGNDRIVVAGQRHKNFSPRPGVSINSLAGGGNGWWITTGPLSSAPVSTAVIRLNDRLQVVTPRSISNNPALAFPERVWATGNTVVVSTDVGSKPLACFSFHNGRAGPVTGIAARLPPENLVMTGDTVYAADTDGLIRYHLPAICR